MDSLHINLDDFLKNPDHFYILLCDKESLKLKENLTKILQEIDTVSQTIENTHINRNTRNIISKILVLYFLTTKNDLYTDKCKIIIETLKESIYKYISKDIRNDMINILQSFKLLVQNGEIHKIGKLDLDQKTGFDNLVRNDKPSLKQMIDDDLEDNRVWYIRLDHHNQKIYIKGELPEDYLANTLSYYDKTIFDYTQEECENIYPDVSNCAHSGCYISEENEYVEHARFALHGDIKEIFHNLETISSRGGSMGIFLNDGKRCYLITCAHVIYPELTHMEFGSSDLIKFNKLSTNAIYNETTDIAMIMWGKNSIHDNGLAVADLDEWKYPSTGVDVVKLGGKTGFRTGKFEEVIEKYKEYKNIFKIAIDNNVQLIDPEGDSGSIYYKKSDETECYIPIGIHRSSNKKAKMYATPFTDSLEKLLKKNRMDIDKFRACNRYINSNGIQGCGNSHTSKRTF